MFSFFLLGRKGRIIFQFLLFVDSIPIVFGHMPFSLSRGHMVESLKILNIFPYFVDNFQYPYFKCSLIFLVFFFRAL